MQRNAIMRGKASQDGSRTYKLQGIQRTFKKTYEVDLVIKQSVESTNISLIIEEGPVAVTVKTKRQKFKTAWAKLPSFFKRSKCITPLQPTFERIDSQNALHDKINRFQAIFPRWSWELNCLKKRLSPIIAAKYWSSVFCLHSIFRAIQSRSSKKYQYMCHSTI